MQHPDEFIGILMFLMKLDSFHPLLQTLTRVLVLALNILINLQIIFTKDVFFQNQVDEGNLAKHLSPKHLHFGRFGGTLPLPFTTGKS